MKPIQDLTISAQGIELIKSFESLILRAYDDATGKPPVGKILGTLTIGYGSITNEKLGIVVTRGMRITKEKAEEWFQLEINQKIRVAKQMIPDVKLTQNQFDALISLIYNVGEICIAPDKTIRKALEVENYSAAADGFLLWNKFRDKVEPGLVRRRKAERELFLKSV